MVFKSNAKRDKDVETGSIFTTTVGNLHVSIHKWYSGETWFLSCPELHIDNMKLEAKDIKQAIKEAKDALQSTLKTLEADVKEFCKSEPILSRD